MAPLYRLPVRSLVYGGLAAICALAGCRPPKPPPSIDGLAEALKKSAEKTLAAPSLANEQIVATAKPGECEARAQEILNAAVAAGGTGIKAVENGQTSILANVPEQNEEIFKGLLRHDKVTKSSAASPGQMRLIEVLIQTGSNAVEASPTPP